MAAHQAPPSLGFSRQDYWRSEERRGGKEVGEGKGEKAETLGQVINSKGIM